MVAVEVFERVAAQFEGAEVAAGGDRGGGELAWRAGHDVKLKALGVVLVGAADEFLNRDVGVVMRGRAGDVGGPGDVSLNGQEVSAVRLLNGGEHSHPATFEEEGVIAMGGGEVAGEVVEVVRDLVPGDGEFRAHALGLASGQEQRAKGEKEVAGLHANHAAGLCR